MKKYFTCLAIATCAAVASNASAGGADNHSMEPASYTHYGLSAMYDEISEAMAIGFDIEKPHLEFGLNASIEHEKFTNGSNFTGYNLGSYLGYRRAFKSNFYGSVGAMGSYTFLSNTSGSTTHRPYAIGPYLGFEYQPSSHVQLFARIMPYTYERETNGTLVNEYFEDGQIGLTYFF